MDSEKFKAMIEGFRKQLEAEHLDYVMVIVNHQTKSMRVLWVFIPIMVLMFLPTCSFKLLLMESQQPSILLKGCSLMCLVS